MARQAAAKRAGWQNKGWHVAIGLVAGFFAARAMQLPRERKAIKRVLKWGFAVHEVVTRNVDLAREDFADLMAEARDEYKPESEPQHQPREGGAAPS